MGRENGQRKRQEPNTLRAVKPKRCSKKKGIRRFEESRGRIGELNNSSREERNK